MTGFYSYTDGIDLFALKAYCINHGLKAKGGMGKSQAEELFAEAQRMAQLRYKSYVRKTQENWEE